MQFDFGRSEAVLSEMFYEGLELFEVLFENRITTLYDELLRLRASMFA